MPLKDLNPAERFIWRWRRGKMSGFRQALIDVIKKADIHNLEKLRKGFPDEVEGYVSYRWTKGWWDDLEAKMDGEKEAEPDDHEPDGLDLHKRQVEAERQEEAKA